MSFGWSRSQSPPPCPKAYGFTRVFSNLKLKKKTIKLYPFTLKNA